MYNNYVKSINSNSKWFNIFIPLLISITIIFIQEIVSFILLISANLFLYTDISNYLKEGESFTLNDSNTIAGVISMILAIIATIKCAKLSSGMTIRNLGFTKKNFLKNYLGGYIFGTALILIIFGIIFSTNSVEISYAFRSEFKIFFITVFIFFIFQGLFEEVIIRAYIMPHFSKVFGNTFAIIFSSILFAALHLANDNITYIAVLDLFLGGLMLALIYYFSGNILLVGAIHSSWNFVQGNILGMKVSGIELENKIFNTVATNDKNWLHGGEFGIEGSVISCLTQVTVIIIVIILIKRKNKWN